MIKINIFLDDKRPCPIGFTLARSAKECLRLLEKHLASVQILSLDHDLEDLEPNGYWVSQEMVKRGLYADSIYFHSSSPSGRKQMMECIKNGQESGMIPVYVKLFEGHVPESEIT